MFSRKELKISSETNHQDWTDSGPEYLKDEEKILKLSLQLEFKGLPEEMEPSPYFKFYEKEPEGTYEPIREGDAVYQKEGLPDF